MLRVATYNAGLAVGVLPHVTERLPLVVSALSSLELDLLFVQEFWLDPHWQALVTAVGGRLPHALRPEPVAPPSEGPCRAAELQPLEECAQRSCPGLRDEALARCVVEHCAPLALTLPTACLNCVASHPYGTLEEILGRCRGSGSDPHAPSPPSARYGGLIAYGGSFGTGLLSRTPLTAIDRVAFHASVNARGAVFARVETELGPLAVVGAHLSPGGAEQGPQVDALLRWIDSKAGSGPVLLLGDLNTTPGSTLFARIEAAGFRDADVRDRGGTYGPNALAGDLDYDAGWRLDHVLVRNLVTPLTARRVLDQPVTVNANGATLRTGLSDHCGVLATLHGVSLS